MFLIRALRAISKGIVKSARNAVGKGDIKADLARTVTLKINSKRDRDVCKFCRSMDGRTIEMPLLGSRNFMHSFGNLEKQSGWGKKNLLPPYHPNCRCTAEAKD
jgi:hypothetical protein